MNERNVVHTVKIERYWWREIDEGRKTSELRRDDRDYQIGDRIVFNDAANGIRLGSRRITHVLKHVAGLEDQFVVLSLNNPDYEWQVETAERRREWLLTAERRIASLKGVITKQRKVIAQLKELS